MAWITFCASNILFCAIISVLLHGYTAINPNFTIKAVGDPCELGEGPFWDSDKQLLIWVDMLPNLLNSYNPKTGEHVKVKIDCDESPVSLVVRVEGTENKYVVGIKGALYLVTWDGISTTPIKPKFIADVEDPKGSTRLNDGKADPEHRLWVGSMGKRIAEHPNKFEADKGSLYLIDSKGKLKKKKSYMQISNGLDWSLEKDKMFLVDSHTFSIYQFDYDNKNGKISNEKVLFDTMAEGLAVDGNTLPDGMTIDSEGMLWVAMYGTQKVIRISPKTGKKIFEITIKGCLEPTSVAFGGPDLDILYITSGRVDWQPEFDAKYPLSGHLFEVKGLGVKGTASRDVILDESILKDA